MGADGSRQRVAVGNADGGMAETGRRRHQLLRMRAAAQEAEIAGDGKLGEGTRRFHVHANTPWTNQRGAAPSRS